VDGEVDGDVRAVSCQSFRRYLAPNSLLFFTSHHVKLHPIIPHHIILYQRILQININLPPYRARTGVHDCSKEDSIKMQESNKK
jgi:hypothetical protein